MGRALVLVTWMLASACGDDEAAPPAAPTGASTVEPAPPPAAVAPAAPIAIGWDHLPADPDRAARAANAAALRLHGQALGAPDEEARRIYEGSLAAFQTVAREHPDYLFARYNAACALSRLGRTDESAAILRELLAIDLPTFAPRLESDPDLAPLAASPAFGALTALREELSAQYTASLREGVPLVHVTPAETIERTGGDEPARRRTYQAGIWIHASHRFVPLAPRIVREIGELVSSLSLIAVAIDVERAAVLVFEGQGSWSEGGGPIGEGELVVYDAGTGRERARLSSGRGGSPAWCPPITAHATATGAVVRFVEEDEEGEFPERTRRVGESDFDPSITPRIDVTVAHASVILAHGTPPAGVSIAGAMLERGEARVPLPPEHPSPSRHGGSARTETWLPRDESSTFLLTAGLNNVEWDSMETTEAVLSVVHLDGGAPSITTIRSVAQGIGALVAGPDAAYAQLGDQVWRLPASGEPEALPAGLVILASPPGTY